MLNGSAALVRRVPILGVAYSVMRYFVVLNATILFGFVHFMLGMARPFRTIAPRRA